MKLFLFGNGKMGTLVARLAETRGHRVVATLEAAEAAIDFSYAEGVIDHLQQACALGLPVIIGTTGWDLQLPRAKELVLSSHNAALYAPNFSLGVAYFRAILRQAQALLKGYALAGVEWHHAEKKDYPSGTAKAIAHDLHMTTPFAHVRAGSIVGKHEVLFDSAADTITLTHEAKNRDGFALGSLHAAEWIRNRKGWFTLDDMFL